MATTSMTCKQHRTPLDTCCEHVCSPLGYLLQVLQAYCGQGLHH